MWLPWLRKWCHGLEDHLELEDFYRKVITVLQESNPGNHVGTTIKLGQHWRLVGESKLLLFRVRFPGDLNTCHSDMHSDQSSIPLNQKDPRHASQPQTRSHLHPHSILTAVISPLNLIGCWWMLTPTRLEIWPPRLLKHIRDKQQTRMDGADFSEMATQDTEMLLFSSLNIS